MTPAEAHQQRQGAMKALAAVMIFLLVKEIRRECAK